MLKKIHVIGLAAICLGLILFGIFPRSTFAANFYVDGTSGTDQPGCGNDPQGGSPCRTIQYTINAATSGDTISVASGTYDQQLNLGNKNLVLNGNNVATLTYTGATGDTSIVIINQSQTSATVIQNFTITVNHATTPRNAIAISGSSYPIIQNNTFQFTGSGQTGYSVTLNDNGSEPPQPTLIRNNVFNVTNGLGGGGIWTLNEPVIIDSNTLNARMLITGASTATIVNNVMHSISGYPVAVDAGELNSAATAVVAHNTITNSDGGIWLDNGAGGSGALTAYVKNNILTNKNQRFGLLIERTDGTINFTSDHNFFNLAVSTQVARVTTGAGNTDYSTVAAWQASSGNPDANSLSGNPLYTNSANGDYTLQSTSTAIGIGTQNIVGSNDLATYSLTQDYANNPRPLAGTQPDAGAYEHQTIGDLTSITVTANRSSLSASAPTASLIATGNYTGGSMSTQNLTTIATWSSSNSNYVVIGPSGVARGKGTGSANATASYGSVISSGYVITTTGLPDYISLYFDAVDGNDATNDGTQTNPYKTLSKLNTELFPMARYYLKGTFTGTVALTSSQSGNASYNTWIANWPGYTATVDGNGAGDEGTGTLTLTGADYVTIQGLTITGATDQNGGAGIAINSGSDYVTVNGNTIRGNRYGILESTQSSTGTNHVYSNNLVYNNASGGVILSATNATDVFNNVIYENTGNNIVDVGIAIILTGNDNVDIWNNTIVNHANGGIGIYNLANTGVPSVTNLTIKNNLIAQTTASYAAPLKTISAVQTGLGNSFDYNLYYTTNSIPLVTIDSTNYSTLASWQAASAHDDTTMSGDPLFISLSTDNYTIANSSPAVNAGTPDTSAGIPTGAASDVLSVARNSRYDIGAYETSVAVITSASSSQHSGGTYGSLPDQPRAELQMHMNNFQSALILIRFIVDLPTDRVALYVDFNRDGVFSLNDLRMFMGYLRGY